MTGAGLVRSVKLVPATAHRAADLARLHADLFDPSWSAASFAESLAHPGAIGFLALAGRLPADGGREPAGFVLGRLAADEGEILSLGVARGWQRRGLGRRLVEELVGVAGKRGVRAVHLEVGAGNTAARALYGALGFRESGRRRGYYVHAGRPAEDAIDLRLAL
jgi:ribosomal-protein-alanine N-acetyltransferase